jgi:biopolymer transport protein TolQ
VNPELSQDLSLLHLVVNASLPVQIVMALLLGASVMSWWFIFIKMFALKRALRVTDAFEHEFWGGADLNLMYKRVAAEREEAGEMERIFEAGFREFSRLRKQAGIGSAQLLEGSRRAMRVAQLRETDRLEQNLSTLATIGSTSPYVGLFGTVWGIMSAFQGLGNVQQATLAMVAPGIAEALIATAMGLFAAIPAVVAYNRYADQVGRLELRYDAFMEEFSTILQRHAGVEG